MNERFRVLRGRCRHFFAYDVGQAIDLEACARLLGRPARPGGLRHERLAPEHFQFEPPPLRIPGPEDGPEVAIFDFGAISLAYASPLQGSAEELALLDAGTAALAADARRRVEGLLSRVAGTVAGMALAPFVEDYVLLEVEAFEPRMQPRALLGRHAAELARILRSEPGELSEDEVADALGARISYGPDDLTLVDWNGALVFGPGADDTGAVLEFANVQLLELRFLDDRLDRALDGAYEGMGPRVRFPLRVASRVHMARIGRMQVDAAILYERVRHALKLLGDQFLARLYRIAATRFHLAEWEASIRRKLETIESIYQKTFDRAAANRMELLEWLIIVLIAAGIAVPFLV